MAGERSIRWTLLLAALGLLLGWGNVGFFCPAGQDWLGTKPLLGDPAIVTLLGHLSIATAGYVLFFSVVGAIWNAFVTGV